MLVHIILAWDVVISMSIFFNYKIPSATCHYPKQLKNITLKMSYSTSHFLPKKYKLHISDFFPILLKT
jgi:hypothetical protein